MNASLLLLFVHVITATDSLWRDYGSYDCDLTISAFDLKYQLTLSQCQDTCANTTNCKGVTWYEYKKKDVPDPSRCYLLDKICDLISYSASPATTSFWYKDMTSETECIDYPTLWTDRYADDCGYYSTFGLCEDVFNLTSHTFILTDHDTLYYLNAFQVCCSCIGSLFEYKPMGSEVTYFMESVWKPSQNKDITENMICQTYNKDTNRPDYLTSGLKWDINVFLGVCDYFAKNAYNKFRNIYSLSSSPKEDLALLDYKQLNTFDCIHDNLFSQSTTFYLCNEMDYGNYPYIIDISSTNNYSAYLNAHFIDISDFEKNLKNNQIIIQNECNIESLINNNNESNILAAFLCELITESPTMYPSISPTLYPTKSPTKSPSKSPTLRPTLYPSLSPTLRPTWYPTPKPSHHPSVNPYAEKKQVTAWCLTFFFGMFGAGRWYVGETTGAVFQLVMFILVCCAGGASYYFFEDYEEDTGQVCLGLGGCICFGLFIWWIADLVIIGKNNLYYEEMPLEPW